MVFSSVEVPIVSTAMRAAMTTDEDASTPAVQFDDTCVVIPDPVVQSRMPRLVRKSYSLPLWRKRSNSNPPLDTVEIAGSPEDRSGVSFTVPLPSFSKSRSPTRGGHIHQPLVSCLVNGPTPAPRKLGRRPSLQLPLRPDAATVPLRSCCRECYPITEECLRADVVWEEKFTRGARRRRNSSADARAHAHIQRHRKVTDDVPGFEAVVFADEIDRRRSGTFETLHAHHDEPETLTPSFSRKLQLDVEPASRKMAIAEEAEEELFPLPSPSASSSHLPLSTLGDGLPLLSQSPDAAPCLSLPRVETLAHDEDDEYRASVYYTPEASPSVPPWEAAPASPQSSSSGDSDSPLTPPPPAPPTSSKRATPIPIPIPPSSHRTDAYFADALLSSWEDLSLPSPDVSPQASPELPSRRDAAASLPGSPELATTPRRKHFMHMPNLPGPGTFFRAGADLFKGVGAMGGPVPLSV